VTTDPQTGWPAATRNEGEDVVMLVSSSLSEACFLPGDKPEISTFI